MKCILYVGDFRQSYSTEKYIAHGFTQLGYQVVQVQQNDVPNARALLGAALKYKPDFVMFSKWTGGVEAVFLLRQHKFLTVGWIFDLYFNLPAEFGSRNFVNSSFQCDICFVTDGGHATNYKSRSINARTLRQGIYSPEALKGIKSPQVPIIFLGSYNYNNRIKLIDWLRETYGHNFLCFGQGGDKAPVRGVELNNLLASVKIVVGDSVPSDFYWSNRIYEVLGRGGFLLHPKVKGLDKELIPGKHYVEYEYGNFQELKTKIDFYLDKGMERETIRDAGFQYVKKHYTYTARCRELLKEVAKFKSQYHK